MQRQKHPIPLLALNAVVLSFAALSLSACDWVDSAGRENNEPPTTEILLEDGEPAGPQVIEENSNASITIKGVDSDGSVRNWQWSVSPVAQGPLAECGTAIGFNNNLAVSSLSDACASSNDCQVQFELTGSDADTANFLLRVPELNAPVGLRYSLTATDNDGGKGVDEHTFCLVSVNNPPMPQDDTFTVLEGQVLTITANDTINLLSNDDDDDDVNSKPLKVSTTATTLPASADVFSLGENGGFSYSFAGVNLLQDVTDSFEYSVTDGQYSVTAEVTINVVARNDEPIANGTIGVIEETAGVDFTVDFADFFTDPEGNTLGFSVLSGDFPSLGGIELSPLGVLSGVGEPVDVGDYSFTLLISDGVASSTADISLSILDNEPVVARAIASQTVEEGSQVSVSVGSRFTDPEAQPLTYSIDSSEAGVNLTITARTGVIGGFISEPGEYDIDVSADDGYNTPTTATITFEVEAENSAPVFSGTLATQNYRLNRTITPLNLRFSDPDGDTLSYRVQGVTPSGLSIVNGRLTGRPRQTGTYPVIIVATDPGGLSDSSNRFIIRVTR